MVEGSSFLTTKKGYFTLASLIEQEVKYWNGQRWSKGKVVKRDPDVIGCLEISTGLTLLCSSRLNLHEKGPVNDIPPGTELTKSRLPQIVGRDTTNYPLQSGIMARCCHKFEEKVAFDIPPRCIPLMKELPSDEDGSMCLSVSPPINGTPHDRACWLTGYFTARSFPTFRGLETSQLAAGDSHILQILGLSSQIYLHRESGSIKQTVVNGKTLSFPVEKIYIPWSEVRKLEEDEFRMIHPPFPECDHSVKPITVVDYYNTSLHGDLYTIEPSDKSTSYCVNGILVDI